MTPTLSRRRLLALAGGVAVAGCNGPGDDDDAPSFDATGLQDVAALGAPTVPDRLPVTIAESYLDDARDRVERLLDPVPADLADAVPNEAVQQYVAERRDDAERFLGNARDAETRTEAMGHLRVAGSDAAAANAAVATARDERTREDVLDGRAAIREDLAAFRDRLSYEGGDPGPTVVVYEAVESYLDGVTDALDDAAGRPGNVGSGAPLVGETADRVEAARSFLADAEHLHDQHLASLDDARPVRDAFEQASKVLVADARRRVENLPDGLAENPGATFDRDLSGTAAREVLVRAATDLDRARSLGRTDPGEDGPATALLRAHTADRTLRAFERVRSAVADGRYDRPTDTGPIRAAKLDSLAAVEEARRDPSHPALTNHALVAIDWGLREADERIRNRDGRDPGVAASEAMAGYAWVAARAAAVPASNRWLAGAVRAATATET